MSAKAKHVRKRIIQWFWFLPDNLSHRYGDAKVFAKWTDPWWERFESVQSVVAKALCRVVGHEPERDQCSRPEHDFCIWCQKSMPGGVYVRERGTDD